MNCKCKMCEKEFKEGDETYFFETIKGRFPKIGVGEILNDYVYCKNCYSVIFE